MMYTFIFTIHSVIKIDWVQRTGRWVHRCLGQPRSGIGPGGLAIDYGGYGGGGIQDLLGEGVVLD